MTLTVRLLLLVALAVLPTLLVGAYNEYALRQSREVEIKAEGLRLADQSRRELQQIIEGVQRLAATLAQIPTIQEAAAGTAAPQACADLLARLRREYPGQVEIGVANREGQARAMSSSCSG